MGAEGPDGLEHEINAARINSGKEEISPWYFFFIFDSLFYFPVKYSQYRSIKYQGECWVSLF